jgi:uncharacterized OsmC-like protein
MAAAPRTRYSVEGENRPGGAAAITSHASTIDFDGTATSGELLPSPADLLAAALAACILKNVERFAGAREEAQPDPRCRGSEGTRRGRWPSQGARVELALPVSADTSA